ncbi:Ribonuclease H2 non-catalytic subunit (Ylr154p-like) [Musa troglodytarum]|uniref:Ribonuclease H2 non-catalytic subunit (Ylr154p-like) n=1 Tax=Musa troglodytarum TaxID=320322 RepID=A0A9E7ET59_9LILI|nr:Ribonuclease H2 non-catalytic subunit (Ylr154p-like) [Musa troglodytarum]
MEEGSSLAASCPGGSNGGGEGSTGFIDLRPLGSSPAVDLTDRVHLLPCCIKHHGPCPVSHYFKPKQTDVVVDDLCLKEAFFRGRKLQGVTVPLPAGYRGYVLDKSSESGKRSETSEGGFNRWLSRAEFGNLTYWNHDSLPSPDDPLMRCFHWFSVSNALHKPVTQAELDSAMPVQGRND